MGYHVILIVAINVTINSNSSPAKEQEEDDLVTDMIIRCYQVDSSKANRNVDALNRAELFVNCRLMSEVWSEG
jgi:hypothetical protein